MFATQLIENLQARINDSELRINELEAQLREEREVKKQLENECQKLLTITKAGESAIAQVANFLSLTRNGNESELEQAFWLQIDSMKACDRLPPEPPEPTEEPEPEPETEADTDIIDILTEVVTEHDTTETEAEVNPQAPTDNSEPKLTYSELMRENYEVLKAIAHDLKVKGSTKNKLCSALRGLVTRYDIVFYSDQLNDLAA